jgi:hypothetical protein
MDDMSKKINAKGPQVYENWKASLNKDEVRSISEYPLFSDARVTGQETDKYKPYAFLNPVPIDENVGYFRPIIYARIEDYLQFEIPEMSKTATDAYHGGTLVDEIAALVSLALGIRIRAGNRTRDFQDNIDPRGHPVGGRRQPEFLNIYYQRLVIPNAKSEPPLDLLYPLASIPSMSPDDANALIKAARSYQKALLIAEEDPSMSWLFLVTAIEKAAFRWKIGGINKVDILREFKPTLCKKLKTFQRNEEILLIVAEEFINLIGSTKKFIEFMMKYMPKPPLKRPKEWARICWEKDALKKSLVTIYDHRSKALHEGTPFPLPMCDPAYRQKDGEKALSEKPFALAYASRGGTWMNKDIPMYLNTFEYIVRKALLKWWLELGA